MAGPPPTLRLLGDTEVNYPTSGRFKLLGSWLPDCEDDMMTRIGMAWAHLHDHRRWWSNPALPRIVKRDLFKVVILTILTYGAETWTLMQELEQRLDGAVTKMLRKALNIPFGLHISNEDLYADLHVVKQTRTKLARVAEVAITEFDRRFPPTPFTEAWEVLLPVYWVPDCDGNMPSGEAVRQRLQPVTDHYCVARGYTPPGMARTSDGKHAMQAPPMIDRDLLTEQYRDFRTSMVNWPKASDDKPAAWRKVWADRCQNAHRWAMISEWVKLAMIMVSFAPGSVANERLFSAMNLLKCERRNRLQELHMDASLRIFMQGLSFNHFEKMNGFERAHVKWTDRKLRRPGGKTGNQHTKKAKMALASGDEESGPRF
eukprot:jgi/Mesvir1/18265/Mv26548-RA.1